MTVIRPSVLFHSLIWFQLHSLPFRVIVVLFFLIPCKLNSRDICAHQLSVMSSYYPSIRSRLYITHLSLLWLFFLRNNSNGMICFCNGRAESLFCWKVFETQLIIIQDSSMAHLASLMPDSMVLPFHLDVILRFINSGWDFVMAPLPITHR